MVAWDADDWTSPTEVHRSRIDGSTTEAIAVDGAMPLTVAVGRFIDMIGKPDSDIASLLLAVQVTETLERCSETIGG